MKRKQPESSPRCDRHITREQLPAWYHRLVILPIREYRGIEPRDFDEDISELGEGEGDSDSDDLDVDCEYGIEDECECGIEDECECDLSDDDTESEHSYVGPDANDYYDLKNERISRKIELRDEKKCQQEARLSIREFESRKEQEVHAAYEAMLEAQKKGDRPRPRLGSIVGKYFNLYCVDHVDYCYTDLIQPTKYVEFYYTRADGEFGDPPDGDAEIIGHVYLHDSSGCNFALSRPPKRAGPQKIRSKIQGSEYELVFQFISDKYLTMTVRTDSEMVKAEIRRSEVSDVPNVLKFVGIEENLEE